MAKKSGRTIPSAKVGMLEKELDHHCRERDILRVQVDDLNKRIAGLHSTQSSIAGRVMNWVLYRSEHPKKLIEDYKSAESQIESAKSLIKHFETTIAHHNECIHLISLAIRD